MTKPARLLTLTRMTITQQGVTFTDSLDVAIKLVRCHICQRDTPVIHEAACLWCGSAFANSEAP